MKKEDNMIHQKESDNTSILVCEDEQIYEIPQKEVIGMNISLLKKQRNKYMSLTNLCMTWMKKFSGRYIEEKSTEVSEMKIK